MLCVLCQVCCVMCDFDVLQLIISCQSYLISHAVSVSKLLTGVGTVKFKCKTD